MLVGCGRMGSALLRGWFDQHLRPELVDILDPNPPEWIRAMLPLGLRINPPDRRHYDVIVIATKPQYFASAVRSLGNLSLERSLVISVAAGISIPQIEEMLGQRAAIVRAMPNTPAEFGHGMTCIVANQQGAGTHLSIAEGMMMAVGQVAVLTDEDQMHAVTAVSGSGPAYVFAVAEAMEDAAITQGLPRDLARKLVAETIRGAAQLMVMSKSTPSSLREAVTSPGGTTEAALRTLQEPQGGLAALFHDGIKAATDRSRELANI